MKHSMHSKGMGVSAALQRAGGRCCGALREAWGSRRARLGLLPTIGLISALADSVGCVHCLLAAIAAACGCGKSGKLGVDIEI